MNTNFEIERVFSLLHDGTITEWVGDLKFLTLTIECQYLAELIEKSYDVFYIDLIEINRIALEPWTNSSIESEKVKGELTEIFEAELEINSADINADEVVITCYQSNSDFNYTGGNLKLSANGIKVYDQSRREVNIYQLENICKSYWNK